MKAVVLVSCAALLASLAQAQESGRVLSATPIQQQVGVPRQVCSQQWMQTTPPKSGAGALMGAIAGGAIGNSVGQGSGRAAATLLGLMSGAIVGDSIEGAPPSQLQPVQHCSLQTFFETRTVAYQVVYEYAGKQYSVQLPQDPGATIALQITPLAPAVAAPEANAWAPPPPAMVYESAPMLLQGPGYPVYPAYINRPMLPPVTVDIDLGYHRPRWHPHHHRP